MRPGGAVACPPERSECPPSGTPTPYARSSTASSTPAGRRRGSGPRRRPDRRPACAPAASCRRSAPGTPRRSRRSSSPAPAGSCRPTSCACATWSCTATRRAGCSTTPSSSATPRSPTGSTRSRPRSREDVFVVASQSGINGSVVELALLVKQRGHHLIAVTSVEHTARVAPRHPSGHRLADLADVVLDNGAPYGDALLPTDGGGRVCAVSSVTTRAAGAVADRRGRTTVPSRLRGGGPYLPLRQRPRRGRAQQRPRVAVRRAPPADRLTRSRIEETRCP